MCLFATQADVDVRLWFYATNDALGAMLAWN
jgi:hypothetical protein